MSEPSLALSVTGTFPPQAGDSLGKNKLLPAIEAVLDPAILAISVWMISFGFEGELASPYVILSAMVFAIAFPGASRLRSTIGEMINGIVFRWFLIASTLLVVGFISEDIDEFPKRALITWLWVAPLCQIGASLTLRSIAPHLMRLQGVSQKAVIVGLNEQGVELASRISTSEYSGINLSGFFDDRDQSRLDHLDSVDDVSLVGNLKYLPVFVKENNIQLIYLSLPMMSQPRILDVLDELKDTTASIYFVPDMFVTDLIQGQIGAVCGMPVISVCETPFTGSNGIVKWISDITLSILILILISPILLIIALAVKFDSPGPVIFKQRRYGLDGDEILVYKFRSMSVCEDGQDIQQAQKNDNRLTRLGAFLRKSSLDELPQFINVLQGRMSIVGPRPHAVAHNELYRNLIKGYMIRHKVKPGITGWAQVNGFRGETDTLDKMQSRINFDLDYLRNWTLKLDLQIILKTVLVVFKREAAY
jgi:putative colanic acid biosynthesis UDP-glucose lipid carrier transferase